MHPWVDVSHVPWQQGQVVNTCRIATDRLEQFAKEVVAGFKALKASSIAIGQENRLYTLSPPLFFRF